MIAHSIIRPDMPVWYAPHMAEPRQLYAGVVDDAPRRLHLGGGVAEWVVRLREMDADYQRMQRRMVVPAASLLALYLRHPVPPLVLALWCPACGERHLDVGEWRERPHRSHLCLYCTAVWRPCEHYTVGV